MHLIIRSNKIQSIILNKERVIYLLQKYSHAELQDNEKAELILLFQNDSNGSFIKTSLEQMMEKVGPVDDLDSEYLENIARQIMASDKVGTNEMESITPVRNIGFRRNWLWAAASFLALMITGSYLFFQNDHHTKPSLIGNTKQPVYDVDPGMKGAILKLADGTEIVLDSLGNGVLAIQNGTQVALQNGQLINKPTNNASGEVLYNTISTPQGREFQLTLSDGSQVWLNAESSITYPTVFKGKNREVTIKGEAYFEVAKNVKIPFKVRVNNKTTVEVLGTHFNINAYPEEDNMHTTLLEGSVKVTKDKEIQMLLPGQQARISNSPLDKTSIKLKKDVDIEKVMAWKNGLFNFEGATLGEVMRKLSRWYGINVTYEKGIPDLIFIGEMSKNISLSGVLAGLKGSGVNFRIEKDHKLVVLP